MKKNIVTAESIQIPFKARFAHHSASRESTETVIVTISNGKGQLGFGESCPRSYVTGETISSALTFIDTIKHRLVDLSTLEELILLQKEWGEQIDLNPTAWCAVEMAMLDLLAREVDLSVEQLLGIKNTNDLLSFSAVLGIDSFPKFLFKLFIYKSLAFSDFKVKLSGNQANDLKVIELLSYFSRQIRVDANNLFVDARSAIDYLKPFSHLIWAIEEPVKPQAFLEMKEIANTLGIKIILDESFLNQTSMEAIKGEQQHFIPNLRISKLGGVLRTLTLVNSLEEKGFQWILGSHVGEMSLLTRASLLVSGQSNKNLIAKEGGFSTHLLSFDPFFPNLKLGSGARIKHHSFFQSPGWGMVYEKK